MKSILKISFIAFWLIGCETQSVLDLPEIDTKLVVNSIFYPDSLFKINITSSKPNNSKDFYLMQKFDYIKEAEISVTQNGISYNDFEYRDKGFYISTSFVPETSATCQISVSTDGFETIQSQSQIPYKINIDSLYYSYISDPETGDRVLKVNLVWNDPPDENYYYIFGMKENSEGYFSKGTPDIYLRNHPIFGDWSLKISKSLLVFDDKFFNGKRFNFELLMHKESAPYGLTTYSFYLCHISKDFYLWAESLGRYSEQNSFFDEPVVVYNNIENGLGIFAGCNVSADTLYFVKH
jgi:hypothetical protein